MPLSAHGRRDEAQGRRAAQSLHVANPGAVKTEPIGTVTVTRTAPRSADPQGQTIPRGAVSAGRDPCPAAPATLGHGAVPGRRRSERRGGALAHAYLGQSAGDPKASTPTTTAVSPVATIPASAPSATSPCRDPKLPFDPNNTRFACPPCEGKAQDLRRGDWLMRILGATGPTAMPRPELPKEGMCALHWW